MSGEAWTTLAIIAILFLLLIWDHLPTWAVFAGALTAILTLGLAPENEVLGGFSNSGVLSVVVLFVVAEGMYRTGAISLVIDRVVGLPATERAANARLLPLTAAGSAFLNNTPIVAMLVPVVGDLGRSAKLAVSKIYMFVSHASILGGATTLIGTSTNLIIAGLVFSTYGVHLTILFPSAVGVPAAIIGLAFILFVGERLLGTGNDEAADNNRQKAGYRAEFVVTGGSTLPSRTLSRAALAAPDGARLISVARGALTVADPQADWILAAGDMLTYDASVAAVGTLWANAGLVAANPPTVTGREYAQRLREGVIALDAPQIGQRLDEVDLRGLKVVAVSRASSAVPTAIADTVVAGGDVLIMEAGEEEIGWDPAVFTLARKIHGYRVQRTDRALAASVIVTAMVLLSAFGVMSLLNAALLAAAALIATGCLSFRTAFRAIDWETYVILACAVGLEPAMTNSGLADVIARGLSSLAGDSVLLGLVVVFLGAIVITNLVTNTAAAVLLFPITAGIVASLGAPWQPFVVVLMLGCSYAFINPAGYQTHLMVMKPGHYSFGDFARVGILLTAVLGIVVVPLAYVLYR